VDKTKTLGRLEKSRQAFLQAIAGLSETQIIGSQVEGIWTIKDLLAHLTSWERACAVPLRFYASGGNFLPEAIQDIDKWNESQARRWRGQTVSEIQAEYQAVRAELVELISILPADRWDVKLHAPWGGEATVAELCSGLVWHESIEHLKSILQWKETGKPR
jgi:DinB superfamily